MRSRWRAREQQQRVRRSPNTPCRPLLRSVRGALGDRAAHLLYMLSCMVAAYVIAFMNRCVC